MVKFGKNKIKILNKLAKKQNDSTSSSNKLIKKKINAEKKVSFQKEVLLKQALKSDENVKKVKTTEVLQKKHPKLEKPKQETGKTKVKPVEKHKKRQQTRISDTKLLLSLMKKK